MTNTYVFSFSKKFIAFAPMILILYWWRERERERKETISTDYCWTVRKDKKFIHEVKTTNDAYQKKKTEIETETYGIME